MKNVAYHGKIDLRALRRELEPIYASYAEAQQSLDRWGARNCKEGLQAKFRQVLQRQEHRGPGIYIFVGGSSGEYQPIYIGKANVLSARLDSWFKNELCLDANAPGADSEDLWDTAFARIQMSMHQQDHRKHPEYAIQHVHALWLMREAQELWLVRLDSAELVEAAESLLIYSATSLGMRLFNAAESNKLKVSEKLSVATSTAIDIIGAWRALGLQDELASRWLRRVSTLGKWFGAHFEAGGVLEMDGASPA